MHKTTVRFSPSVYALIRHEAELEGVSAAAFVRDAAYGRAAYRAGRRKDATGEAMERLARKRP